MPFWSVACSVAAAAAVSCRWASSQTTTPPKVLTWPGGFNLCVSRLVFLAVNVGTLCWSYLKLSHVEVCSEDGDRCLQFSGAMQFSTFTRWSWMLQGLYYCIALFASISPQADGSSSSFSLQRAAQILFQMSFGTAMLVTTVTYTVLVPGAVLINHPPHRAGNIEILLSPQGHIMHSLNTVFIVSEMLLCRRQKFPGIGMWVSDLIYGVLWCLAYVMFEWIFHWRTGLWHYPFLDYHKASAEAAHLVLVAVFVAFWYAGSRITGSSEAAASEHKD
eukprot:TRINITY_DN73244_c0_g1_i1.p1 TRINITY_DN73244_c0_g1~~TRINITY_DN73244_c0_g1_i1.p1  ORF type:complete len:275 (-),score=46.27 TRINITY_DN73244_c0_g1_i1:537-1361(-)